MSTGVPIYLVSACTTGEEFVAAFRRYADRNGLFVPMADPLPSGRKGRVAVTLRDGGVMVEGQVEIISSGKTPSIVHGRIGVTLKFVEPDAPSKTVLGELEKARLAMKPPPPSVAPRPATIPAEPRPVPPALAGRIDASNALAECVAIGDVTTLAVVDVPPPKAGPRFVVPTIPPVGSAPARARTTSTPPAALPPAALPRPASATTPPSVPAIPPTLPRNPTGPTLPALTTARTTQAAAVVPPPQPSEPGAGATGPSGTSDTMVAVKPAAEVKSKITTTQAAAVAPPPKPADHEGDDDAPIEPPPPAADAPRDRALVPVPQTDTIDIEANLSLLDPSHDTPVSPMRTVSPSVLVHEEKTLQAVVPPRPPAKPAPALVADSPPTPRPPVVAEARPAFDVELAEPTDLTEMPMGAEAFASPPSPRPREVREPRRTSIGVAVVPTGVTVLPARAAASDEPEEPRDTALMTAMTAGIVGPSSVDGRAKTAPPVMLEVQEPTPSGDWTISPGPNPTIQPARRAPAMPTADAKADSTNLPTGDWTIALDSDSPDGWTPPEKLEKPRAPGPAVTAVASAAPLESRPEPARPPEDSGPKVHVDPTLIQPLTPMPLDDSPLPSASDAFDDGASQPRFAPQQHPIVAPPGPLSGTPMPAVYPTPAPMQGPIGFPMDPSQPTNPALRAFDTRGSAPVLPGPDPTAQTDAGHRRRVLVIVVSAVLVLVAGVVAVIVLGGRKQPAPEAAPAPAPAPAPALTPTPPSVMPTPPPPVEAPVGSGSGGSAAIASAPPAGPCTIEITTVPDRAALVVDGKPAGTSPATLTLPCDTPAKLVVRKPRFTPQTRTLQPSRDSRPLKLVLTKPVFTVKISSKPPGATVSLDNKSLGVTPMITKLPAFEAATLVFTKDGFAKERQQITPKTNNQAIQATLKKSVKPRR